MAERSRSASGSRDPLRPLVVIDRLEVGPVRVEPRGLVAPYRVARAGRVEETELAYRYEQDVFEPGAAASMNLATLIAAQVALNYGLFCREIVFHGPLSPEDRAFLAEMAANTAREIFVKKFLEPNPFLVGAGVGLPPVQRRSYLQAALKFPDRPTAAAPGGVWPAESSRPAVLSSGGKESLLSYALLRELGQDPLAVFVNESGRHWYTALNGYRHLASTVPERTVRVWTSADRVFAWMLRHLPFVREDFAKVRSDEYPVRLWTVAVFLFGALPVLRKRGIGRLVIGDEYDTTRRTSYRGIPHYDGLYDQSRYFDNALTRYYHRKGWPVAQFSILRPLSELLVQKILVRRYPELHRHQVSCHSARVAGERALPCGRCEKCRRVVGMLVALKTDAAAVGYSSAQVDACLRALAAGGAQQEAEGVQHLFWMLSSDPAAARLDLDLGGARERPEILKLRFDPERSPAEVIPEDLRRPLVDIFLEHADGAVKRSGRGWQPFDPVGSPVIASPAILASRKASTPAARSGGPHGGHLLAELTWPEARRRFKETDTALLPVGAIEQHGPHLPLDTDAWDADYLCRQVAERCSAPRPFVLPLIPYGVSYHHLDFSGTLSVNPETLSRLVYDVGTSAARHGVTKLIIVNGHGGNGPTLQFAAQMINRDAHIFTCVETGETSEAEVARMTETPNDAHAGEIETSTGLATRPELVHMDAARKAVPRFSSQYLDFSFKHGVEWYAHTARISRSGVLGDPTKASREKGERIWEATIRRLLEFVETIKSMSLSEIYQKKL